MKLKALIAVALLAAGLSSSIALAGDGHGNGREHAKKGALLAPASTSTGTTTSPAKPAPPCRPALQLELAGTVAGGGAASLQVAVTRAGGPAKALVGHTATFDTSTARIHGTQSTNGPVRVHARACVDLVAGTVSLVAAEVAYGGPKPKLDDHGTTSTTTTSTTTTTTSTGSTS